MIGSLEGLHRAVFDGAVDGILVTDETGKILIANESAHRQFGYGEGELVGTMIHELFPDDLGVEEDECPPELPQNLVLAFAGLSFEVRACHRDGRKVPVEVAVSCIALGPQTAYTLIARDASARIKVEEERQRLQLQLAQSQKLESVGQLAAGVAHEINTPTQYVGDNLQFLKESFDELIAVTDGYFELLKKGPAEGVDLAAEADRRREDGEYEYLVEEVPSAIDQAIEGIRQIAQIVSAMKAFCHPGSQEVAPVDLNAALENTISVARNEWKYVSKVALDLDRDLPPVPCSENELKQVFVNIIVNAAHAIEEHRGRHPQELGEIIVRTRVVGRDAEVSISDNGPGIPDDVAARIFDPFFTTKAVGKGTGQGLAIARSIVVDKHAGRIEVRRSAAGGAEFAIRLPLSLEV